ncbi:MAG: hypothetical protein LBP35_00465 [Candidatus Ancillula trichonymphae]|nr:hypothetical protein [Candidatus Ancillula trichonymphae]
MLMIFNFELPVFRSHQVPLSVTTQSEADELNNPSLGFASGKWKQRQLNQRVLVVSSLAG